jgi:hypothetical protein
MFCCFLLHSSEVDPDTPEGIRGLYEWAEWFETSTSDRVVFQTELLGIVYVSTGEGHAGRIVAVPFGKKSITCPVRTLEAWLKIRGREPGPLFTRLDNARSPATPRYPPRSS